MHGNIDYSRDDRLQMQTLTTDLDEEDVEEEGKVGKSLPRVRAIDHGCRWIEVTMAEPGDSFLGFLVLVKLLGIHVPL